MVRLAWRNERWRKKGGDGGRAVSPAGAEWKGTAGRMPALRQGGRFRLGKRGGVG